MPVLILSKLRNLVKLLCTLLEVLGLDGVLERLGVDQWLARELLTGAPGKLGAVQGNLLGELEGRHAGQCRGGHQEGLGCGHWFERRVCEYE